MKNSIVKRVARVTKEGIYEFISRQKTSVIPSVDEQGYPVTRALIQPVPVDGNDICFATYIPPRKVRKLKI